MIEWSRHFSRVYCIHYLPYAERIGWLKKEFERVGLSDSGILRFRYTNPCKFDHLFGDVLKIPNGYVNLSLEFKSILNEALGEGLDRILILENDVCFRNDLGEIEDILSAMPSEEPIVQLDKFYDGDTIHYKQHVFLHSVNDEFFMSDGETFNGGDCFSLTRQGAEMMLGSYNVALNVPDSQFRFFFPNRAIAKRNICVQGYIGCCMSDEIEFGSNGYRYIDLSDFNMPIK